MLNKTNEELLIETSQLAKQCNQRAKQSKSLLRQESSLIQKLTHVYQNMKKQIVRSKVLGQKRLEMQKTKILTKRDNEESLGQLHRTISKLQKECSQKEKRLQKSKAELVANAVKTKAIQKQTNQTKKLIEQKQRKHIQLKQVKEERVNLNVQVQNSITKASFQLKRQYQKKLALKQQLLMLRLEGFQTRSNADLQQQVRKAQLSNKELVSLIKALHELS